MSGASPTISAQVRRLAAILSADVVGYSRLMGRDEAVTVHDLEAHQAAVLPIVEQHGGSVINIAGDGIVAEFPSAVRAVECAAAIQKIMAERNADIPEDRRMQLRIGVNLGDIVHEGEHVYGDGINVAARLEPLAQPGGICISATVRDAIIGNLALPLEDLGEKSLKNIERPVRIYEIPPPGARARNSRIGAGLKGLRRATPLLAIVVVLLIAGVEAWRLWPSQRQALEYAPAIAVLPFVNAQRDANLDYLGPSLAREVSAGSQHFRCCASSRPQAFRRRNSQIRSGLRRSLGRIMRWRAAF
jgi:adenylate cyclase